MERGKVLELLGREMSTMECTRVPGQNTPKRCWRGQLGTYEAPRAPWVLHGGLGSLRLPVPRALQGEAERDAG